MTLTEILAVLADAGAKQHERKQAAAELLLLVRRVGASHAGTAAKAGLEVEDLAQDIAEQVLSGRVRPPPPEAIDEQWIGGILSKRIKRLAPKRGAPPPMPGPPLTDYEEYLLDRRLSQVARAAGGSDKERSEMLKFVADRLDGVKLNAGLDPADPGYSAEHARRRKRAQRCREKLLAALHGLKPDLTTDPRVRAFLAPAGAEWDKLDELA